MLPVVLLPLSLDLPFLITTLKSLFIFMPPAFLLTSTMILLVLSLKTMTAKLVFLGSILTVNAMLVYIAYLQQKSIVKKMHKLVSFHENIQEDNSETKEEKVEHKELMLSKMFKK